MSSGAVNSPVQISFDCLPLRSIGRLDIPLDASPEALWKDYFTTYNRPPLGDRVQEIVDALVALRRAGSRRVELIGLGAAGPWALLARGVAPEDLAGGTAADLNRFPWDDDRAYLARGDAHRHVVDGDERAVGLGDPGDVDGGPVVPVDLSGGGHAGHRRNPRMKER